MRLIDADKLILHLNDYALQEAPFGRNDGKNQKEIYDTIQECMKAVEEQPTAFDVEKVIEILGILERNISMQWIVTSILMEHGYMAILATRIISMIKALMVNF